MVTIQIGLLSEIPHTGGHYGYFTVWPHRFHHS